MTATGPIASFGAVTGGPIYIDGTYLNVPLTLGSGTGAVADVTIAGNIPTTVVFHNPSASAVVNQTGKNYRVGNVLSASDMSLGGVTGLGAKFGVVVASLAPACENCFYGRVVPSGLAFGLRYCSKNAVANDSAPAHDYSSLVIPDDQFCGDGADAVTGLSFSTIVNGLPGAPGIISKGTFTCAANKDTVVTNAAVLASSHIVLTPTNAAAATLMGGATSLYTSAIVAGVSFTVTTANAGAAAGTETFAYEIT